MQYDKFGGKYIYVKLSPQRKFRGNSVSGTGSSVRRGYANLAIISENNFLVESYKGWHKCT